MSMPKPWITALPHYAVLTQWLLLPILLSGCGGAGHRTTTGLPVVTVIQPVREEVTEFLDLTGTLAASRRVDLVARVTGYLQSADFEDGTLVKAGQVLFLIEPENYQQQLVLASAAHLRAKSEYERQLSLREENATSAAAVERWLSERDEASARVELARLNLSYTRVTAPFSGRIGRRLVDPGNLVGPSVNTKLATLEQIVPIYVNFNLNERDVLRLYDALRQQVPREKLKPGQVPLLLGVQNQSGYPYRGTLDFVDTGLDTSSGTILLRGTLRNEDRALLPGLFARVRIPIGQPRAMYVVPNSAIGNDQQGDYVLIVDLNDTVARRDVLKGPLTQTGCAIQSGINATDRVISKGQMKAPPGTRVSPTNEPPALAPENRTSQIVSPDGGRRG